MLLAKAKWNFAKSKKEEPKKEEAKNAETNQESISARQL